MPTELQSPLYAFTIIAFLFSYWLYWLPVVLVVTFWTQWKKYLQLKFVSEKKYVLLGIRLPQDIHKTPIAMELVLSAMHKPSDGNWFERNFQGKVREWFSLEIISIEGDIRFYIRTFSNLKNFVEAQLYSQFPGIEVYEAEDYTSMVDPKDIFGENPTLKMFGTEFTFVKHSVYPIKTYVDFGLNTVLKKAEEAPFRTDPITPTIEFLGTLGKGEQVWLQIVARAHGKIYIDPASWFGKRDWKCEAKDLLAKMQAKAAEGKLSKADTEAMAAIEREIAKFGFDCGIRSIYIADADKFSLGVGGAMRGFFKQYGSENLNSIKPIGATAKEYPLENYFYDLKDLYIVSVEKMKKKMFKDYRARGWFYVPFKNRKKPIVMNTEELATIYHFPSGLQTPGFVTISSRKAEPPSNLPI